MRRNQKIAALLGALLVLAVAGGKSAIAADDPSNTANACSIAAGRNAYNNTLVCNFGLTPEQLKQATEAAVRGATEPLLDRIDGISQKLGVTKEAAKTLLRIVGQQPDIPDDKLAEALTKVAADYKQLQTQAAALDPDNATARRLVSDARAAIDAGSLTQARALLKQATQAQVAAAQAARKLRDQAQAAEDVQLLGAAQSTAAEADVALTERHYDQAAGLFAEAATYVPSDHHTERLDYIDRQADALFRLGGERGDNQALQKCIGVYRRLIKERTRERVPLQWAMTQMNLGIALSTLGERESGTARLEQAVDVYRAALEEWTRERVPLQWAMTQMNLGTALFRLGSRESGTARLEQAVDAYRAALEEWTRERVPLQWAMTQMNLGTALSTLGERESGTASLEQAVAAYDNCLSVTRSVWPPAWVEEIAAHQNQVRAEIERRLAQR